MDKYKQKFGEFKSKATVFLRERGLYLVLIVCLAMVGVAAAIAITAEEAPDPNTPVNLQDDERIEDVKNSPKTSVSPAGSPAPTQTLMPNFTANVSPTPTPKPKVEKANPPVDGEVLWAFAMDELIYSKTLDQWTTHSGVDIAAKQGDEVRTVLGGKVLKVYEDELYGMTVVVEHDNKRQTVYSNLKKEVPVQEGKKINAGDVIGNIGDTAVVECGEKSHLHFEFHIDGKPVDPAQYVRFPAAGGSTAN